MYKVLKSQKSSFDTVIFSPANCLTCTGNLQTAKCRSLNPYMFIIANHVFESARKRESMRITNGLPTMVDSPWSRSWFFIRTKFYPLYPRMLCLVEIGQAVLERTIFKKLSKYFRSE